MRRLYGHQRMAKEFYALNQLCACNLDGHTACSEALAFILIPDAYAAGAAIVRSCWNCYVLLSSIG
jgi:hypothetical protein